MGEISQSNHAFNRYFQYLEKVTPHSPWVISDKNDILQNIFGAINENLVIIEILIDNEFFEKNDVKYNFLKLYQQEILSFLIIWPNNHKGFVAYNIRSVAETLLKLVYAKLYPEKNYETVSKTGFRYLKDESKAKTQDVIKEAIIKLCSLYGSASRNIHGHSASFTDGEVVLDNYFENHFESAKEFSENILEIMSIFLLLINKLFGFKLDDLSTDQKLRIVHKFSDESKRNMFNISTVSAK